MKQSFTFVVAKSTIIGVFGSFSSELVIQFSRKVSVTVLGWWIIFLHWKRGKLPSFKLWVKTVFS